MVTLEAIRQAEKRIAGRIIRTPLVFSPSISAISGARVFLKLETLQKAGSFKVRGAASKILADPDTARRHGVVTASAGNHAQGVAIAAHAAGVRATIVMPVWASLSKQEAARSYGAEILLSGSTLEESLGQAENLAREGRLLIHPYDDEDVIAGQGTIGLEILEDLPETDLIVVPVGGGGLIAGIATAATSIRPAVRIIGAQAAACPSAYASVTAGSPVQVAANPTIADGIRVARTGTLPFPVIQDHVSRIALATEDEIAGAMLLLLERKHIVAEGAGAVALAVLLNGSIAVQPGSTIVLVISGGNVDSHQLFRIIRQAMARQGRILQISVLLEDRPGSLASLLRIVADRGGNVLHIDQMQGGQGVPVMTARVEIEIETRGPDHGSMIGRSLRENGFDFREL